MLHAIPQFRALSVVPSVGGADEVAGNPAYPLEFDALPYLAFHNGKVAVFIALYVH